MCDGSAPRSIRPIELFIAIATICAAVGLLLPALQSSRGPEGQALCRNNLKNLAIALRNYHNTYKVFPMGATHAGAQESPQIGPSWWYGILPYIDQQPLYDKIGHTQSELFFQPNVEFTYASMPSGGSGRIQAMIRTMVPTAMRCPSSPLPEQETREGFITMPSYVGIAGGCDVDPDSEDYASWPAESKPQALYRNAAKGPGPHRSIVTSSGLLPVAQHVTMADCTDGTSNVMIVGEQSGWLRDVDPAVDTLYHGDPGWNRNTDRNPGGWLSGTNVAEPVGPADRSGNTQPGDWSVDLLFNVTTVRYGVNQREVLSNDRAKALPGCAEIMGHNNPLQSAHPGGLLVAMCDGSCPFITTNIDLAVLLQLAIRNDGAPISLDEAAN